MGDQAAHKANASAQLRWIPQRAQLLKDIQARNDAARHNQLEIDNKQLRETVQALEGTRQKLENELGTKDRDLAAVKAENDKMATNLKEMIGEHAKRLGELTSEIRACERNAQGLLAFVRCACLQMKDDCGGRRIEYAARLMRVSEQARKEAQRLADLVKDSEAHRAHYSRRNWNLGQDPLGHGLAPEQIVHVMTSREQAIEHSMQEDRKKLKLELSKVIPDEVIDRAFELLSVTREEVVRQLDATQQDGKQ